MSKGMKIILSAAGFVIAAYIFVSAACIITLSSRVSILEEQQTMNCSKEVEALIEEIGYLKEDIWLLLKELREKQCFYENRR